MTKGLIFILISVLTACGKGVPELSHNGICEGFSDSSQSAYRLPWATGETFKVSQGNCSAASHYGPFRYAYDFNMPSGSNIHAARAGTVLKLEESKKNGNGCSGGANYVTILHSDGTVAEYLHLSENGVLVSLGASVNQGDPIAISGNTGCSSGAHLHFNVYRDESRRETIPVNFQNTATNPRGLVDGKSYTAL